MNFKIGFIGVGNMGGALLEGALRAGILAAPDVTIFDVDGARLQQFAQRYPVVVASAATVCAQTADFLFLCVKPQQMKTLLQDLAPVLKADTCLVSIAAGVSIESIQQWVANSAPILRVMPNTPALLGYGLSALCCNAQASANQVDYIERLLASVGKTVRLRQDQFDALTAVSGSGPAYVFYLAQGLRQAAVQMGLGEVADVLVQQTFLGAAQMLQGQQDAATLRQKVTSPGGTTQAAIEHLAAQQWLETFQQAVYKAKERSVQLTQLQ